MAVQLEVEGNKFRVQTQEFSTQWLPDTPINRQMTVVWLRLLVDENGKPLFTLQELAAIVGSANRQAASQHVEEFRQCGEDVRAFVQRQRKVDATVVEGALKELMKTPLVGPGELADRVNEQLGRQDLTAANMKVALEQIPYARVVDRLHQQVEVGQVQYKESYLLEEMMASLSPEAGQEAGLGVPEADQGMRLTDPTAITALVTPDVPIDQIPGSLVWVSVLMALYYWNVPLSVLGRWFHVHQTTILRWMLGLALAVWPLVYRWIRERVKARMVYVDEKWIKIRGRWHYWFVVLDTDTELPVLAALLPSRGQWACRWIGCQLKRIKKIPSVMITDGLAAYESLLNGAKHVLCRFHHQQGVSDWLKKRFSTEPEIIERQTMMKKVFQTEDKRTVRRRLAQLRTQADQWGISPWLNRVVEKLPSLICSVGSVRLPSTTNAIERFFRVFNRFYKTRCGFHSVVSAKRELILFLVVYLFTQRSTDGKAPVEAIVPEASRMPLYRLINDPLGALRELGNVKQNANMADFLLSDYAAA